jgi:hypothetical protein
MEAEHGHEDPGRVRLMLMWIFDDICILVVSTWMDGRRIYTQTPGEQIDFISQ